MAATIRSWAKGVGASVPFLKANVLVLLKLMFLAKSALPVRAGGAGAVGTAGARKGRTGTADSRDSRLMSKLRSCVGRGCGGILDQVHAGHRPEGDAGPAR